MTMEQLAHIAEISSGIIVAFSLVILVFEIHQNVRRQRVEAVKQGINEFVRSVVAATASKESAEILVAGAHGLDELSNTEQARFHSIMLDLVAGFDQIHSQYENGMLDDAHFLAAQRTFISLLKMPGALQWWSAFKHNPPKPLVAHIESVINDSANPIPGAHEVMPWLASQSA